VAIEHKCFELIEWFPDNILRFIGQNVQTLGGQDKEREINAMMAGSFGRAESARGNQQNGNDQPQDPVGQGGQPDGGSDGGSGSGGSDAQSVSESQGQDQSNDSSY
jgi:hypothetical protein